MTEYIAQQSEKIAREYIYNANKKLCNDYSITVDINDNGIPYCTGGIVMPHYALQIARSPCELLQILNNINDNGYEIIAVTQNNDKYTVIYDGGSLYETEEY